MKTPHAPFWAILICNLLLITSIVKGQSVTIGAISGSQFCAGDPIAVTFTATGTWGAGNVFLLQLSEPNGSFSNTFQNIGSLTDALPGTFTINTTIPTSDGSSTHYRFRILASSSSFTSFDNGSDIAITARPVVGFDISLKTGSTGVPIAFTASAYGDASLDSAYWDFGAAATPAKATITGTVSVEPDLFHGNWVNDTTVSFSQNVTYSTSGRKTVTLTVVSPGGCSETVTYNKLQIYDCSIPSIPHDAIVINADTTITAGGAYWINPGVKVILLWDYDTIFAEPGSTISGATQSILYMKPGSVFSGSQENVVIFGDGASIDTNAKSNFTLNCPALDFDYSNAPPNPAHPSSSVKNDLTSVLITLSPNPTDGMVSVQGLPSDNITVSVFNTLGETVMEQKYPSAPDFTLDLSKFVPGTYYIRFSSANSVVTKTVVKE